MKEGNARVRIRREQVIDCYDEQGNQKTLLIEKNRVMDVYYTEHNVKFDSVFGSITLPTREVFFLKWLDKT